MKVDKLYLFGGSGLLLQIAKKYNDISFAVSSDRQLKENVLICNSNLRDALIEQNIPFISCNKLSDITNLFGKDKNPLYISIGAPWIFGDDIISLFSYSLFNIHGSRLPADRGGGGYSWRILRDDRTGISLIHKILPGIDTGPTMLFDSYIYPSFCKIPKDFYLYSWDKDIELFSSFIKQFENVVLKETPTNIEYLYSYWPRLCTDIDGFIDWGWSALNIERFINAFDDPYQGATTFVGRNKARLKKCSINNNDGIFHPFQSGIIYRKINGILYVSSIQGNLIIEEATCDVEIKVGDRFYTPVSFLENAKAQRVYYDSKGLKL